MSHWKINNLAKQQPIYLGCPGLYKCVSVKGIIILWSLQIKFNVAENDPCQMIFKSFWQEVVFGRSQVRLDGKKAFVNISFNDKTYSINMLWCNLFHSIFGRIFRVIIKLVYLFQSQSLLKPSLGFTLELPCI